MRLTITILFGIVLLVISRATISDEVTAEALESKIASMEQLIVTMASKDSEWKVRSAMQKHALLMAESVVISEHLFYSKVEGTNQNPSDSLVNSVVEQHDEVANRELQLRTTNTLLRHAIIRQNIMMERMGLFKQ